MSVGADDSFLTLLSQGNQATSPAGADKRIERDHISTDKAPLPMAAGGKVAKPPRANSKLKAGN